MKLNVLIGTGLLVWAAGMGWSEDSKKLEDLQKQVDSLQKTMDAMGKGSEQKAKETDLKVQWKDGLFFSNADGTFSSRIGGRASTDWDFMAGDEAYEDKVSLEDGTELRQGWIYISGDVYAHFGYKFELSFEGGEVGLKETFVSLKDVPVVGEIKVGHFKEPFSLEQLASNLNTTFMERSLADALAPGYNAGGMVSSAPLDQRVTWALGGFADTDSKGTAVTETGGAVTGRVTGLPLYQEEGKKLVHLGAGFSYRYLDTLSYSQRPGIHLSGKAVDTKKMATDYGILAGLESALVWGPFSVQAELVGAQIEPEDSSSALLLGYYGQVSYFLTGESRAYKMNTALFGKVKPKKNFVWVGDGLGCGAWELAARYDSLDLSDGDVAGGEVSDITLGVNWHWNPNMRVMTNYVRSHLKSVGDADLFGMRFQVDF